MCFRLFQDSGIPWRENQSRPCHVEPLQNEVFGLSLVAEIQPQIFRGETETTSSGDEQPKRLRCYRSRLGLLLRNCFATSCNCCHLPASASTCQHLLPAATCVHHTCYSALPCFSKRLCASQCPAVGALVHAPAALPSSSAFLASWRQLLLRDPLRKACQKQHTANKH